MNIMFIVNCAYPNIRTVECLNVLLCTHQILWNKGKRVGDVK